MTSLTLALAILDLALALAVSAIAILGSRRALPDDTDPLLVRQALHRARLHFSILALGWTLTLAALLLALEFQATPERVERLILLTQGLLLAAALLYEAGLYGAPRLALPNQTMPRREDAAP